MIVVANKIVVIIVAAVVVTESCQRCALAGGPLSFLQC